MAKSKDDIKYGTAQAKLNEHEALRVRYKAGTPLEGGKIAESEPVDLFSSAHNISQTSDHSHLHSDSKVGAAYNETAPPASTAIDAATVRQHEDKSA
ncbi:hypothetical protein L1049_028198 [Liquidambar formosana]|uniref:Seed maturation protein n=1 Tax=Liquidambar formosana TaxID=63359 RepID=A0AAP0RJ94_LIQFO